jgi:chorismate mutase/prephenate dehydratase
MATLQDLRGRIDHIDRQIVGLLDRRAQLARQIGKKKSKRQLEFFDAARQKIIVNKVFKMSQGHFPKEGLAHVFTEIMSACLAMEQPLRVGYFGQRATFTHLAAISEFGSSVDFVSYNTISDIFLAVDSDWINYGVVPIENSTGGIVHHTLDMFLEYDLRITSEIVMAIHQNLLSRYRLDQISKVFSSPQPFAQCQIWLKENLPTATLKEVGTTVEGVQLALKTRGGAAIASELAAKIYKLKIVARAIEDVKDNCTRFLVIGKQSSEPTGSDKTSLMFSIKDRPGALFDLLKPFAKRNINLTKIESRPTKRKAWEYVFFVDLMGHVQDSPVTEAIKELEDHCLFIKILGSYPRDVNIRS